jgi:hypothetical protein
MPVERAPYSRRTKLTTGWLDVDCTATVSTRQNAGLRWDFDVEEMFLLLAQDDGDGEAADTAETAERLELHGLHAREPRVSVLVLLVRRAARAVDPDRWLLDRWLLLRVGHEFSVTAKRRAVY